MAEDEEKVKVFLSGFILPKILSNASTVNYIEVMNSQRLSIRTLLINLKGVTRYTLFASEIHSKQQ